jgi:hypothetical protein
MIIYTAKSTFIYSNFNFLKATVLNLAALPAHIMVATIAGRGPGVAKKG